MGGSSGDGAGSPTDEWGKGFFPAQTGRNALSRAVGMVYLCQKRRPDDFHAYFFRLR